MFRLLPRLFLGLVFSATVTAAAPSSSAPLCEEIKRDSSYQLGIALQWIMPGKIPGLANSFTAYGVILQARLVGPLNAYGQGTYSSAEGSSIYLMDAGLKLDLVNPFLRSFLMAGVNHFRFDSPSNTGSHTGPNAGVGIGIRMGDTVEIPLTLKVYFREPLMVSAGGGLVVLL